MKRRSVTKGLLLAVLILTVVAGFRTVWSAAPATLVAQERIMVSYAGFAGFQAPVWAAKDFGLFAKYGLSTDLVMIPGSARGTQALLAGSTHFGQIDGTALISAINQGADLVIISASLNKFPFSLVAQNNIRKPADLIGKKVGIVSFGGAHEVSLVLALKEWNIPRQSVTLLAPPETGEAARMGLHTLAHMTDLKAAAFPMNVIATRRSFLEKNRDLVKRFLQAYSEATYQFMTNKEKSLAMFNQRLKQKNPGVVEETYQYFAATFSFPPRVAHDGMRIVIEMIAQRTPGAKLETNVDKYVDERLLDELEREGLFKRISGKG